MRRLCWLLILSFVLVGCVQHRLKPAAENPQLQLAWRKNLGYGARLQLRRQTPISYEDSVYFCDKNRLIALRIKDGKRMWQEKFPAILTGCLARFANYLYLSDEKGGVYAYDLRTRTVRWQTEIGEDSVTAPTANEQIVLVQTTSENLYAINAHDGNIEWSYNAWTPALSLFGSFRPLLVGPYGITGFADGSFVIHEWETGRLLSYRQIAVPRGRTDLERIIDLDGTAVFAGGVFYFPSYSNFFLALDLQQGREKWRAEFSGSLPPVQSASSIYAVDKDNNVHAFSRANGSLQWIQEGLNNRQLSAPLLWNDNVVVGDNKGFVHVLSPLDGSLLARRRSGLMPISNFLVIVQDMLIVLDKEGFVSAFKPYQSAENN